MRPEGLIHIVSGILILVSLFFFFFFKQKTAYEMCGRDWSSDVCSSDLISSISSSLYHLWSLPLYLSMPPLSSLSLHPSSSLPLYLSTFPLLLSTSLPLSPYISPPLLSPSISPLPLSPLPLLASLSNSRLSVSIDWLFPDCLAEYFMNDSPCLFCYGADCNHSMVSP